MPINIASFLGASSGVPSIAIFANPTCDASGLSVMVGSASGASCTASACTANTANTASSTRTCGSNSSVTLATSSFGKASFYGEVAYQDDACAAEYLSFFIRADNACYPYSEASSALANITNGAATVAKWTNPTCSGTPAQIVTGATSQSCKGKSTVVVMVNGALAAASSKSAAAPREGRRAAAGAVLAAAATGVLALVAAL
ncbi:hypothetical protein DFJ73DRAFT_857056, partial [Zopfochytrium polystomum]